MTSPRPAAPAAPTLPIGTRLRGSDTPMFRGMWTVLEHKEHPTHHAGSGRPVVHPVCKMRHDDGREVAVPALWPDGFPGWTIESTPRAAIVLPGAPPPPPTEGPGLAQVARRTAALLGDAGQASNRILSLRAKVRANVDGAAPRADLDADLFRLFSLLDLAGQELRAALAAEEARARKDRALRERWRDRLLLARAELVVASQKEAVRRARERIHAVVCELIDGTSEPGSTP